MRISSVLAAIAVISGGALQGCSSGSSSGLPTPYIPCTMGSGTVTVSGQMTFDRIWHLSGGGLDFNNITQEPIRGAVVETICNGVVSTSTTDSSGNYSISVPANSINVAVRVKAQMQQTGTPSWNYAVVDNSSNQAIYALSSSPFNTTTGNLTRNLNAASGWTGSGYTATRSAGPFAILDSVYDAHQLILSVEPSATFPALNINWNPNNTDGTYYNGNNEIFVLGALNDTDEYDYHVIIHEWGHYFQDNFSRDDSIGGPHGGGDRLDIRVAFSEGFGNAFSAIVSGDPQYRDSIGLTPPALSFSLENNSCTNAGWFSECSVQSIFYDLHDAANDDGVALGFSPLYDVLHTNMPTADGFSSVFSFISPLRAAQSAPVQAAIDTLLTNQSITSGAIDQYGSTETNNGGSVNNLPVYETTTGITCNSKANGEYNKLGNYRFFRVTGSGASVTFNANRSSGANPADPDLVLYHRGQVVQIAESIANDTESLNYTLQNGLTYILSVYEYSYVDRAADGNPTETCFNVTW